MSTALKQTMTADEFLGWAEGKEGRWELHDGVPALMSPEPLAHIRTKFSAATALKDGLKQANLPCEVFADRLSVKIDARTAFEPDASVVCGPRRPDDTIVIADPILVVEVLSPSTAAIDHGRKLSVLDPERRVVIHHKRGQGEAIETRVLTSGAARLNPPGFEVAVEALFPAQ